MATTTTLNKTAGQTLLAITNCATATITVGSAVDVSTKIGPAVAFIKLGRTAATALANQVKFRLEGSAKTSGNDEWIPIYEWTSNNATTAASSTTLNGATTAGNTTSTLTSGTGFGAGDLVYFKESTLSNSEWSRLVGQSGTTSTFEEAQTRNHANGITVSDTAEMWQIPIDIAGQVRIRFIVDCASAATTTAVDIVGWLVTTDSANTA